MTHLSNVLTRGLLADRPADNAAGTAGRLYYATDEGIIYRDNGATWDIFSTDVNGLNTTTLAVDDYVLVYDVSASKLRKATLGSAVGADMAKSVYDTDDDGVVDNAAALETHNAAYFATADHAHAGMGDMTKAAYDANDDGVVDNAAALENHNAAYFATADHTHGINDLTDVDTNTTPPSNGDVLAWDTDHWEPTTSSAPGAHAATHQAGGTDAIKLDDLAAPDDNTDLNASASAHGLLPRLSGNAGDVLKGDGSWGAAASGGHTIMDEGVALTARANLDFVGSAVTVTDDAANDKTIVTIDSGSGTGDMLKATYDADDDGVVDNAEALQGHPAADFALASHAHAGSDITSGTVAPERLGSGTPSASNFLRGDGSWAAPASGGEKVAIFTFMGDLTVGSHELSLYNVYSANKTIAKVHLAIGTAPAGSAVIVDIHVNGTTIFTTQSNRPQIAAGESTGQSTTIEAATWTTGQALTCHIDQVGSGTAGANLVVSIVYE